MREKNKEGVYLYFFPMLLGKKYTGGANNGAGIGWLWNFVVIGKRDQRSRLQKAGFCRGGSFLFAKGFNMQMP
jgi:hypothetical protein